MGFDITLVHNEILTHFSSIFQIFYCTVHLYSWLFVNYCQYHVFSRSQIDFTAKGLYGPKAQILERVDHEKLVSHSLIQSMCN